MFRRISKTAKPSNEENPFLLSFSDLMASLLAIFILALIVTMLELQKRKAELEKQRNEISLTINELRDSLQEIERLQVTISTSITSVSNNENMLAGMIQNIKAQLEAKKILVNISKNGINIPSNTLGFGVDESSIPKPQEKDAKIIGEVLLEALRNEKLRKILDTVFIEGHTDSQGEKDSHRNWYLSGERAISLWIFWTEKCEGLKALKTLKTIPSNEGESPKLLVSVSGYADTRSTFTEAQLETLPKDRPQDRRIEIRLTLSASEKQHLEALRKNLEELRGKTRGLLDRIEKAVHGP